MLFHLSLDLIFSQEVIQNFTLSMLFMTGDRQIEFIIIFILFGALLYVGEPLERLVRYRAEEFYRKYIIRSDDEAKILPSFELSVKREILAEPIFTKKFTRIYNENPQLKIHFDKVVGLLYLLGATILIAVEILFYIAAQLLSDPQALSTNRFLLLFLIFFITACCV